MERAANGARPKAGIDRRPSAKAGPIRVIGIDPGLASTGWGIVDVVGRKTVYRAHGCISTKPSESLASRLSSIDSSLNGIMAEWAPTAGAMEALFFSRNVTSALNVAEAKGVIRLCCLRAGFEIAEYSPVAVKQAIVGSGRADKSEVQEFIKLILKLPEIPTPDHAADALGMAVCHIHSLGLT